MVKETCPRPLDTNVLQEIPPKSNGSDDFLLEHQQFRTNRNGTGMNIVVVVVAVAVVVVVVYSSSA